MAKWGQYTGDQIEDVFNKLESGGGIERFRRGELVLVEKERKVSASGLANGGVTYTTGINEGLFKADWEKHLLEVYGITIDLAGVSMPQSRSGFGWGVVRLQELPAQQMFEILTRRFNGRTRKWCDDIDKNLDQTFEVRTTVNGPYVIWCRDRIEADEELKNLSANNLVERGTNCMTALERIMLEGWFHWKTSGGGHLDIKNITLCAGSRWSGGNVPGASWYDKFYVYRYYVDYRNDDVRAREAVSLP